MKLEPGKLLSARLTLKNLCGDEPFDHYLAWLQDAEVSRYLESRFNETTEDSLRNFVKTCNDSLDSLLLGIFLNQNGKHIGNIKVGPIHPYHKFGDIGILIGDKESWGRGYATESISLLTDYAFRVLKLHKLTAGCYEDNRSSQRAFLKVGFEVEGTRKSQYRCDGRYISQILMGRMNEDEHDCS